MGRAAIEEGIRDGYYCLAIAIIKNCSIEKAQALYEGRTVWVTPEIISEMAAMQKDFRIGEIADMYCMDPHQIRFYLKQAGVFIPSRVKKAEARRRAAELAAQQEQIK